MKKILLVLILVSLSYALFGLELFLGAKWGMNFGRFYGKDWKDYKDINNLTGEEYRDRALIEQVFGVYLRFNLIRYFSIQPEINLTRYGGGIKDRDNKTTDTESILVLEFPLLFQFSFYIRETKIDLFFGPDLLIRLSQKIRIKSILSDGTKDITRLSVGNMQRTAFNLVFGTGLNFFLRRSYFFFESRLSLNLTRLKKGDSLSSGFLNGAKVLMVSICFGVGIKIR
jgi:hypothetical protein